MEVAKAKRSHMATVETCLCEVPAMRREMRLLVLAWLGHCGAQTSYDQRRAELVSSECTASLGGKLALSSKERAADGVLRAAKSEACALLTLDRTTALPLTHACS